MIAVSHGGVTLETPSARRLSRREFLKLNALGLGAGAVSASLGPLTVANAAGGSGAGFLVGVNYPWLAYGQDFGKNAWGHEGLSTNGWTCQTSTDSQGLINTRRATDRAHAGLASLSITADLAGQHPSRSRGEVYVDLGSHPPPNVTVPVNLRGRTVSCWLWLPRGSAGWPSAPNGVQFLVKSDGWRSWYGPWINIQPQWEEQWVQVTASLAGPPSYQDAGFDPAKVVALGLKVAINVASTATLQGTIGLDDYTLGTSPTVIFDFEQTEVQRDFASVASAIQKCSRGVVRVFVLGDGVAAPEFGATGEVTGFDDVFFADFDALVAAAGQQGLQLIPVLLDFGWCDSPTLQGGVQVGGHADIIRDALKRQTFLDRALTPLVTRYGQRAEILAWEIINEPEWAMLGVPSLPLVGDPVSIFDMQDFVKACATRIHSLTTQKVTVGSARRRWVTYWKGLGLDLYQFHWYESDAPQDPFPWPRCADLGLDKACFIGEVPSASTQHTTSDFLQAACNGGYQGLLVWSYRAGDAFSSFTAASAGLKTWCAKPRCR